MLCSTACCHLEYVYVMGRCVVRCLVLDGDLDVVCFVMGPWSRQIET